MQMKVSKKLLLPDWAERRERAFNSTSSISTTRPNAPFLAQLTLPDYFNLQALVTEQQNKKEKKAQTEESPTNKMTRKRHACFRNTQDFGPKKKRNTQDLLTKRKKEKKHTRFWPKKTKRDTQDELDNSKMKGKKVKSNEANPPIFLCLLFSWGGGFWAIVFIFPQCLFLILYEPLQQAQQNPIEIQSLVINYFIKKSLSLTKKKTRNHFLKGNNQYWPKKKENNQYRPKNKKEIINNQKKRNNNF